MKTDEVILIAEFPNSNVCLTKLIINITLNLLTRFFEVYYIF